MLAALIIANVSERADDARHPARTDVTNLMQALGSIAWTTSATPSVRAGPAGLDCQATTGPQPLNWNPYLEKLPNDPGAAYRYLSPGVKGEVDVMSFGADGGPGGEQDADIGSWQ